MATVQSYTKNGVDAKLRSRSPMVIPYYGTGLPELASYADAKTGDVIERSDDHARWKVIGDQLISIQGGVVDVSGKTGTVTLTPSDVGAANSVHTHTKSQVSDLEPISTSVTANNIVKRDGRGDISVPGTPGNNVSAASKSYVDAQVATMAASSHTHTKSQISDLEPISSTVTANNIVKRTNSGDINVPISPNATDSAASKGYVDTQVATQVATRAASSHTHTKANITDLETISTSATVNHLVKRTSSGNITVPISPNATDSAASKSYVDTQVATRATSSHTHSVADLENSTSLISGGPSGNANKPVVTNSDGKVWAATDSIVNAGDIVNKEYADNLLNWDNTLQHKLWGHVPFITDGGISVDKVWIGSQGNYAVTNSYVDARTPKISVVESMPSSPASNEIYIVTG